MNKRIIYLSGALRVSTKNNANAGGPRAHILGTIQGLEALGFSVDRHIVGDKIKPNALSNSYGNTKNKPYVFLMMADSIRIVSGIFNSVATIKYYFKDCVFVYERYAILQSIGWLSLLFRKKWIIESNGIYSYEAHENRNALALKNIGRFHERLTYRSAYKVVVVSEALAEEVIKFSKISRDKVLVVPNGVDIERFRFIEGQANDKKNLIIGFVGSIIEWQNLEILLEAVKKVSDSGCKIEVVIAGSGPDRERLEAIAVKLSLEDKIRWLGQVDYSNVPTVISQFDICYSGHKASTLGKMYHSPLKLYEYMSMGKKIVATYSKDSIDVINDEVGWLFEENDVNRLVEILQNAYIDKMAGILTSSRRISEMAGRKYSWETRVDAMLKELM